MAGFSYDPKLYNKALGAMYDAKSSFDNLMGLVFDVSTIFPPSYEYKNEVKEVCDNLNIVAKFADEYSAGLLNNNHILDKSFGYEGVEESSWSQDLKYAWKATGAAWNEGITSVINGDGWGDMKEALKQTGATLGVTYTTLESGSLKVLEYLKDGKTAITGFTTAGIFKLYDLVTGDNKSKKIMDATLDDIRRDKVGELNKLFYEGTNLGKNINDASNLKYDSNGAEAMKAASEFTTKITLATGATIASGGSLAPVAAGFLYGGGKELEEYGQSVDRENGEEYSYPEAVLRGTSGAVSGSLEWWGYGSLGNFAYTGLKMIPSLKMLGSKFYLNPINSLVEKIVELSPKEIVSTTANFLKTNAPNFLKNTAPNFLKNYGKELLSKENLLPTAAVISDHVISFALGDITADEMLQNIKNELKFTAAFSTVGALTRTVSPKRIGVLDDELDRAISNCRYGGSDQSLVKELEKRGISISDFRKDTFDKFSSKLDDFFNKNGIEAKTLSNHKIITVEGLEKNSLYMLDNKFAFHTDSKGVGYCYSLADDGIF